MKAVFIDIETTGLDFDKHVALDVGIIIVDLNDFTDIKTYTSCILRHAFDWYRADKKALEINGYTRENHSPNAKEHILVSQEIEEFLVSNEIKRGKSLFICQNPSFDRPFFHQLLSQERMNDLDMPYHWLDLASMYWIKFYGSYRPIPCPDCIIIGLNYEISLSKDSIAKSFGIPAEIKPHKAMGGCIHLFECYKAISGNPYCNPDKL